MFYLNGIESGLRNFECFPPRTCPCQNGPPERESTCVSSIPPERASPAFQASPRKGHHLRLKHPPGKGKHPPEGDQASVSSWNCGIGVTGG